MEDGWAATGGLFMRGSCFNRLDRSSRSYGKLRRTLQTWLDFGLLALLLDVGLFLHP